MIKCFQKRDNDIADDREGDENIECTADTVALVADLDDVKYFFLHVESSMFSGAAPVNACDSIIRRWKRKVKKCGDRIRQLS